MKSGREYKESLRKLKPEVYYLGDMKYLLALLGSLQVADGVLTQFLVGGGW